MKTVSLETAIRLKEAGFPQPNGVILYQPCTDELFDELPCFGMAMNFSKSPMGWRVNCTVIKKINNEIHSEDNESLPEALAQVYLYLKKEKLI